MKNKSVLNKTENLDNSVKNYANADTLNNFTELPNVLASRSFYPSNMGTKTSNENNEQGP